MGFLDEETLLGESHYNICGRKITKKAFLVFAFTAISVIAGTGQSVGLPMWIASFASPHGLATGVYFVVFFASAMFNVIFWPLSLYQWSTGGITKETVRYTFSRKHYKLMLIGFCDAMNGILTVYSSSNTRVPGALQPILLQSIIPFTLIFSRIILKKKYLKAQLGGAGLVIAGIVVSLIPTILAAAQGGRNTELQSGWWWPLILVVGAVPGVLMNVLEESVFEDEPTYNITLLVAFESLYQVITVAAFFWTDIIPGFGTSTSLPAFVSQVKAGFSCFFAPASLAIPHCKYSALLGFNFALMYCITYGCGSVLMKLASANYNGLVSAITNPLVVMFWIAFPAINLWAGGATYTALDIGCDLAAMPVMGLGIYLFRRFEPDGLTRRATSLGSAARRKSVTQALLGFEATTYDKEGAEERRKSRSASGYSGPGGHTSYGAAAV